MCPVPDDSRGWALWAGAGVDPRLGPQYREPGVASPCHLRGVGLWGLTHGGQGLLGAGPVWGPLCLPFAAGTSVASAEPRPSSCSCPPPNVLGAFPVRPSESSHGDYSLSGTGCP